RSRRTGGTVLTPPRGAKRLDRRGDDAGARRVDRRGPRESQPSRVRASSNGGRTMNLRAGSEALFVLGRRYPRLPLAVLRALPLPVLHALRGPGLRESFRVAARAPWYRDAFAAARIDVRRARRPEDLGDFFLTPEVLKTRPETLLTGPPELAVESSGTSRH